MNGSIDSLSLLFVEPADQASADGVLGVFKTKETLPTDREQSGSSSMATTHHERRFVMPLQA